MVWTFMSATQDAFILRGGLIEEENLDRQQREVYEIINEARQQTMWCEEV